MKKKGLIIYDFDGVLVNSQNAIKFYYAAIFRHFGLPELDWDNPYVSGQVFAMTHRQLLSQYADGELLEKMYNYLPPFTIQDMLDATPLETGVAETIPELSADYILAICTNRGESVDSYLRHYNLYGHFSYTITSNDVRNPKPSPEGILKILSYFGADNALFVGDSETDYLAAKDAGINFIAFKSTLFDSQIITDHCDIKQFLHRSHT
ncbi:MAG: HAD family hydrolase [Deferribacteraceae bacterium]|nr:HAD family hydrolase [Deferribacteraceae bacterium]